jgi:hypothetical protein
MNKSEDQALEDAELTEGLFEMDAQEVLADFGGQTISSFREKLVESGAMDLMFSYSIISGRGLAHFLPTIDDYSRSSDSEGDDEFPGSLAHAIGNQLRIRPQSVFSIREQIRSLCRYLLNHLGKFGQGNEWEQDTAVKLTGILEALKTNEEAQQAGSSNGG